MAEVRQAAPNNVASPQSNQGSSSLPEDDEAEERGRRWRATLPVRVNAGTEIRTGGSVGNNTTATSSPLTRTITIIKVIIIIIISIT